MNMHNNQNTTAPRCEPYEQLNIFLPSSILRALRQQVPAGQRRAFVARALAAALNEQDTAQPREK